MRILAVTSQRLQIYPSGGNTGFSS